MYFGPGVEADTKSEFWHSSIWQESSSLAYPSIKLKVQLLYFGSELPRIFLSSIRTEGSLDGELWLSEMTYLIEPVTVWLHDTPDPPNYQFYVREILYTMKVNKFDDVMKPIVDKINSLEQGTLMNIGGQDMWIVASLGVITANLPQSNDLADTKQYSSILG
ncbi:15317_t:CDS:2 [Racocetra persica]|uniref:15317_t:CDS:1 n=1 Tax=Racocetra persica TaxID=160502 RepID=A0ACA9KCW7_9GLOM|nr:15317_t:CDS:2 [Racocetra persica]